MPRTTRFVIADVFSDTALAGNQLAVFTNAAGLTDDEMQRLAREINFSESVFVFPPSEGGHARLRIFTPATEVRFAGHPVLGAAFVLAMPLQLTLIKLETAMGTVPVLLQREGARIIFGTMAQPVPSVEPFAESVALLAALGVERSELPVEVYDNGLRHVFVMLPSDEAVAAVRPDSRALCEAAAGSCVNVFAAAGTRAKTRMFAPELGVPVEDAATGSAAGPLALHLCRHGLLEWGVDIEISQGAEIGRPSLLVARASGSADAVESVEVGGSAVIVGRGEFQI